MHAKSGKDCWSGFIIDEYTTGAEKPDEGGIIGLFLGGAPRSAYIIPPAPVFLLPYIHTNEISVYICI